MKIILGLELDLCLWQKVASKVEERLNLHQSPFALVCRIVLKIIVHTMLSWFNSRVHLKKVLWLLCIVS